MPTILIAEDNEFNAMVAKDELKSIISDVEIMVVENGEEALEFIRNFDFDLIQQILGRDPFPLKPDRAFL